MKKTLSILAALLLSFAPMASAQGSDFFTRNRINGLVSGFSGVDGVEIVHIGSVGLALAKTVTRVISLGDNDAAKAALMLKGIKSLTVMDFDDASPEVKARIVRRASRLFNPDTLLMETVDDGEKTGIYGVVSDDGRKVKNFVVFSPDSGALVCLFGTFDMDKVKKLMDN